jgi:hypothetical protein
MMNLLMQQIKERLFAILVGKKVALHLIVKHLRKIGNSKQMHIRKKQGNEIACSAIHMETSDEESVFIQTIMIQQHRILQTSYSLKTKDCTFTL